MHYWAGLAFGAFGSGFGFRSSRLRPIREPVVGCRLAGGKAAGQAGKLAGRQAGKLAGRQAGSRQAGRQAGRHTGGHARRQAGKQAGRQAVGMGWGLRASGLRAGVCAGLCCRSAGRRGRARWGGGRRGAYGAGVGGYSGAGRRSDWRGHGAELSGGGCAGLLREGRWLGGRESRRGGSLCSLCGGGSGRVEVCIVKFCLAGVCRFGNVSVWSGGSARRALSGPGGRSVLHAWLVAAIGGGVAPSDFPPMGGSGRGAAAGAAGAVSSIAREPEKKKSET